MQSILVKNVYPILAIPFRCRKPRQFFIADSFTVEIETVSQDDVQLVAEWNEPLQYNDESYRKKLFRYKGELYSRAIKLQPSGVNNTIYELEDFVKNSERDNLLDYSHNSPFHGHNLAVFRMAQSDYKRLIRHEDIEKQNYREVISDSRHEVSERLGKIAKSYLVVDGQLLERELKPSININVSGFGYVSVHVGLPPLNKSGFSFNELDKAKAEAISKAENTDRAKRYDFSVKEAVEDSFSQLDIIVHHKI